MIQFYLNGISFTHLAIECIEHFVNKLTEMCENGNKKKLYHLNRSTKPHQF